MKKPTDFQRLVWKEIEKIPYGETRSYRDIAIRIGRPKSYRAVANACGKNPLPIIRRVIELYAPMVKLEDTALMEAQH